MNIALVFFFTLVVSVFSEEYTSKYDSIDLEAIIKNDRLLRNYADCLLDRGKCSRDAAELKIHIHDALETGCAKCSEKHKAGIRRAIKYLAQNKKDIWNALVLKYDPNGTYRNKYQELSKQENVTV